MASEVLYYRCEGRRGRTWTTHNLNRKFIEYRSTREGGMIYGNIRDSGNHRINSSSRSSRRDGCTALQILQVATHQK